MSERLFAEYVRRVKRVLVAALVMCNLGGNGLAAASEGNAEAKPALVPMSIEVSGVTVIPAESIDKVVSGYVGRPLGFIELKQLRVELSRLYADAGYINSGFVIPDQMVSDVLQVQAIEGALTEVTVTGNTRLRDAYLASRVQRRVAQPLNVEQVQSTIRWLQADSNITRVDAELLPGSAPGESRLQLSVDDAKRYTIGVGVDNHRSATLGAIAGTLNLSARNLSGRGERLLFSGAKSEGSDAYSFLVEAPVNDLNTNVSLYYSKSDAQIIEARFDEFGIESETETLGLRISHPLVDTLDRRLAVSLALESKTSESFIFGMPFSFSPGAREGKSEVAVIDLGIAWEQRLRRSAIALEASYRQGIRALDSTRRHSDDPPGLNPTDTDGEFSRILVQGLASISLDRWFESANERLRFVVKGTVQKSFDPLMSLEKLSVGGVNSVRGYRENTFVRDNGAFLSAELQIPIWGYHAEPHPLNLVLAPFIDIGWSWDEVNTNPGQDDSSASRNISSAGLGAIWQPLRGLKAVVYWGEQVSDNLGDRSIRSETADYDLQDDGLHFALSYRRLF